MKTCGKCKNKKPLSSFAIKKRTKEKINYTSYCRECNKEYQKGHYKKNKDAYAKKARIWTKEYRLEIYSALMQYFLENPCVDCGEDDFVVLQFDHVEGKEYGISQMIRNCYSLEKILNEISKCEVRCANCHIRKTAADFNWYVDLFGVVE